MKKLIVLIALLIVTAISCTSFRESWERVEKQRQERGYGCFRDPRSGNMHCGYKN